MITITSIEHSINKVDGVSVMLTDTWTVDAKGAKRRFTRSEPMKGRSAEAVMAAQEQYSREAIERVNKTLGDPNAESRIQ